MQDFSRGKIGPQILRFSLPIIAGNLFMQLYQMVDYVIVGQYVGKEALAAVGASTPVIFAVVSLVIGLGSGASVVISQYFGAGDRENVRKTSDTLHIVLVVMGAAIGIAFLWLSEPVCRALKLPEEIVPMAAEYLKIYLGGIFLLFGFNTVAAMLRGVGDSKTPLYFLILSSILNVGLDYWFVVGLGWGVGGAAWATVIATGVAYGWAVAYINKKENIIFDIHFVHLKFDKRIFRQCVDYGLPTGLQQAFVALGAVALMGMVSGYGTDVIAGFSAAMRIDTLAVIPAMNFAMALTSFTGQNVGAGRLDRVAKGMNLTLLYSSITCAAFTVVILVFGHQLLAMFTSDEAVIAYGKQYLVVVCSFYLVFSAMFVINGMLRGAGAMIFTMLSTLVALWGIRIPAALALMPFAEQWGIWWSIPIGWGVGLAMSIVYYRSGKWKNKSIFSKKQAA